MSTESISTLHDITFGPGPLRVVDDPQTARWIALAREADRIACHASVAASETVGAMEALHGRATARAVAEASQLLWGMARDGLQAHGPGAEVACDGHLWRWDGVKQDFASRRVETSDITNTETT